MDRADLGLCRKVEHRPQAPGVPGVAAAAYGAGVAVNEAQRPLWRSWLAARCAERSVKVVKVTVVVALQQPAALAGGKAGGTAATRLM